MAYHKSCLSWCFPAPPPHLIRGILPALNYFLLVKLLVLLPLSQVVSAGNIVEQLPGFNYSKLPFTLETGYIGVGESETVKLFYYFVESQSTPATDPVLLWAPPGPGCSIMADFFTAGPLVMDYEGYEKGLPALTLNKNSWAQNINVIYLDTPVGAGFSYSNTSEGYYVDDYEVSAQLYDFLTKWLLDHPNFLENELYIGGDSYSGVPIPMTVELITKGKAQGHIPDMNLKGYVLSSPHTDSFLDSNAKIPFAHRMTLISDELYESAEESCGGNYVNVDSNNTDCQSDLDAIEVLIERIYIEQILEPACNINLKQRSRGRTGRNLMRQQNMMKTPLSNSKVKSSFSCSSYKEEKAMSIWANDERVQEALHVEKETVMSWLYCNETVNSVTYDVVVNSSIAYHQNFTNLGLRALVMVGDHDMSIPHLGTQAWINVLNLTTELSWQPWLVDAQVGGYTKRLVTKDYALTFATVKGAGHVVQYYKPREAFEIVDRWFARYPV